MTQLIKVFGTEVKLETIRVNVTAVGEGFSVTVQAILEDDDVLAAVTEAQSPCTVKEATEKLVPLATASLKRWLAVHAEPSQIGWNRP